MRGILRNNLAPKKEHLLKFAIISMFFVLADRQVNWYGSCLFTVETKKEVDMKTKMTLIILLAAAMTVIPLMARWQVGNSGKNMPCQCGADKHKMVTLEGTVTDVIHSKDGKGRFADGIHLVIADKDKKHEVHLGPKEWLAGKDFSVKKGDTLRVEAIQCDCRSDSSLKARQVLRGDQSLRLRGDDGRPMWSRSLQDGQRHAGQRRGRNGCGGCSGCGSAK